MSTMRNSVMLIGVAKSNVIEDEHTGDSSFYLKVIEPAKNRKSEIEMDVEIWSTNPKLKERMRKQIKLGDQIAVDGALRIVQTRQNTALRLVSIELNDFFRINKRND